MLMGGVDSVGVAEDRVIVVPAGELGGAFGVGGLVFPCLAGIDLMNRPAGTGDVGGAGVVVLNADPVPANLAGFGGGDVANVGGEPISAIVGGDAGLGGPVVDVVDGDG